MTGLSRTMAFIKGDHYDHPPFHPIIMRWAAKYAGIKYRDFCTDPSSKCNAMIKCARDFDMDWVTVMSDPWAEASVHSGFRLNILKIILPLDIGGHFPDATAAANLRSMIP